MSILNLPFSVRLNRSTASASFVALPLVTTSTVATASICTVRSVALVRVSFPLKDLRIRHLPARHGEFIFIAGFPGAMEADFVVLGQRRQTGGGSNKSQQRKVFM